MIKYFRDEGSHAFLFRQKNGVMEVLHKPMESMESEDWQWTIYSHKETLFETTPTEFLNLKESWATKDNEYKKMVLNETKRDFYKELLEEQG